MKFLIVSIAIASVVLVAIIAVVLSLALTRKSKGSNFSWIPPPPDSEVDSEGSDFSPPPLRGPYVMTMTPTSDITTSSLPISNMIDSTKVYYDIENATTGESIVPAKSLVPEIGDIGDSEAYGLGVPTTEVSLMAGVPYRLTMYTNDTTGGLDLPAWNVYVANIENDDTDISSFGGFPFRKEGGNQFLGYKGFFSVGVDDTPFIRPETSLSKAFHRCANLPASLENWNISNVTTLDFVFNNYRGTFDGIDLRKWDVSNVTNFHALFFQCTQFNQDISNWDVSSGVTLPRMFDGAINFNQNLGSWKFGPNLTTLLRIFGQTPLLSTANYSATLVGWAAHVAETGSPPLEGGTVIMTNMYGGDAPARTVTYDESAVAARNFLIEKGWNIDGDIYVPSSSD